jgi:riboflavin synthase
VDGTGAIQEWRRQQEDVRLLVACAPELASGMVPKGSITVDGVSLTLVDVGADFFSVALIPYTLSHTTLGERRVGDLVNLEIDLLGKYVRKYLHQIFGAPSASPTGAGLSVARLRELGF